MLTSCVVTDVRTMGATVGAVTETGTGTSWAGFWAGVWVWGGDLTTPFTPATVLCTPDRTLTPTTPFPSPFPSLAPLPFARATTLGLGLAGVAGAGGEGAGRAGEAGVRAGEER